MKKVNLMRGVLVLMILFINYTAHAQDVLAFPAAEGFGRFAKGARGHASPSVYFVTNLNDSGSGSFRDAVSQPGRFIVFKVSGIIQLKDRVAIAANTTIAGHTAPGDGVVIYGRGVSFSGSNNTIARYLRIRLGVNAGAGKNEDASGIANGSNIILDHMSFSWGLDEVFSINWDNKGTDPDNITIQNSIIGQGLHRHNHSAGGLIQSGGKISILKSLYMSNKTRNPKVKGVNEFVNNVVYNYGNANTTQPDHSISADGYILGDSEGRSDVLILNNYFISGPATPANRATPFSRGNANFNVYEGGNYFDNNQNGTLDGSLVLPDGTWYPGLQAANFKSATDYATYPSINPSLSALESYQFMVDNVGATLPVRDEVDGLMIADLKTKGTAGFYLYRENDLPLANGGLGNFDSAAVPVDTDNDGIPDEWEIRLNLNPNDGSDALKPSTDPLHAGYLNIEVYLNALAEGEDQGDFVRPVRNIQFTSQSFDVEPPHSTITLKWTNVQENQVVIERSINQETWTVLHTAAVNESEYINSSDLLPNTLYFYRFKSIVEAEESVYTYASHRTPAIPTAPVVTSAPTPGTGAKYIMLTDKSLALKWTGSANTDSYEVFLGTSADNLTKVSEANITTTTFQLTNLSDDTQYFWRVDALNAKGKATGEVWNFKTDKIYEPQLIGYWKFDETDTENERTLLDQTSFQNHGDLSHSPEENINLRIAEGIVGAAIDLKKVDVSSYSASIPHADHLMLNNNSFTLGFWMKGGNAEKPAAGKSAYLFCKGSITKNATTGATGNRFNIEVKDAQFRFSIDNNDLNKDEIFATTNDFFTGDWVYVTVVRDVESKKLRIYKNAVQQKEGNIVNALYGIGEESDLVIGNIGAREFLVQNTSSTAPYLGQLDEVRLFNYALSPQQITAEYTSLLGLLATHTPTPISGGASDRQDRMEAHWQGGENAQTYKLYLGESAETLVAAGEVAGTVKSHTFTNLQAGKTYYWRVDAVDGTQVKPGTVWSFTTSSKSRELIAHYAFDDAQNIGKDQSKYANHAVPAGFTGNPYITGGKFGGAADFSVAGDAAQKRLAAPGTEKNTLGQESFTISYWVKGSTNSYAALPANAVNNAYVLHKGSFNRNTGGLGKWFGFQLHQNGNLVFSIDDDVSKRDATVLPANATLFNSQWNHVVATRDYENKTTSIFINGALIQKQENIATLDIGELNRPLEIGSSAENKSFRDQLDELKIYNYAMSLDDIQRLYTKNVPVQKTIIIAPLHEAADVEHTDLGLSWEGHEEKYNVYMGKSVENMTLLAGGVTSTTLALEPLDGLTSYFWRVDAVRDQEIIAGDVWTFKTKVKSSGKELIAYYSFNDPQNIGKDESKYANHAQLQGFTDNPSIEGRNEKAAVNFGVGGDAAQKRMVAPPKDHITLGQKSFTISYWMKGTTNSYAVLPANAVNNAYILHKGSFNRNTGGLGKWFGFQLNQNGNLVFSIDDDVSKRDAIANTTNNSLFNGQWNHVVATRDYENKTTAIFVNGALVQKVEGIATLDIGESNRPLEIGNSAENKSYRDQLDELKIYNYALTAEDINRLYSKDVPTAKPTNILPVHASVGVDFLDVTLEWGGDEDMYNVYMGSSPGSLELVAENTPYRSFALGEIEGDNKVYYWRVDAVRDGEIMPGDVWTFQTMSDDRDTPIITVVTFDVLEGSTTGTEIGQLEGWVYGDKPLTNWRLAEYDDPNGNGTAPISIDAATGKVYVNDVADYNIQLAPTFTFNALVNNGEFVSQPTEITIRTLYVNEAPSFEVAENIDICNLREIIAIPITNISPGKERNQTVKFSVNTVQSFLFDSLAVVTLDAEHAILNVRLKEGVQGLVPVNLLADDQGGTENNGVNLFRKQILLNINSIPQIKITASPSVRVLDQKEVTLDVSPALPYGYTYTWSKNGEVVGNQSYVVVTATQEATYEVKVTSPLGCERQATFQLDVVGESGDAKLAVGNFLTPNNDGINDFWVIKNLELFNQNEVTVFDSRGNVKFTKRNYRNDWNGATSGGRLSTGVYYYKVVVDGEVHTGSINVVNQ